MDSTKLWIGILGLSAAALLGLNLTSPPTGQASAIAVSRDFQAATAPGQGGTGDTLFILDNRTGQIAIFTYEHRDRTVRARDMRHVREAFIGR
jgi:hypothetical protein